MINAKIALRIRKSVLLLSLIIMIFAFGCGPVTTPTTIIIPIRTLTPSPIIQPTETQIPISTQTPFLPKALIKIVSQSPLTGDYAIFGKDILHGAELAVQQLRGPLMQQGYQVGLLSYDDRNTFGTALSNAKTIVADPEILCAVGPYDSNITTQTSDIYHQAGLAFVAPSNTDPIFTDRSYLEANRVIGRIDGQGVAGARFANDQGFSSVYIISQKDENAVKNGEYFRREADRIGIQVLGMFITDMTAQNMHIVLSRMMNVKPELVYITSTASQAIPFFEAARAAGYVGAFLGTQALNNPPVINFADSSLVEGGGMYYTITSPPANYYPEAVKFIQDFNARYGDSPLVFAARAYDAAGICLKAIEEASKATGGEIPTRAQVANAIRALKDYQGITGTYTFNYRGDPSVVQYYVYKIVSVDAAHWDQNLIIATYAVSPPQ
jgi:branched-chain amino acid transport system substrate-binding protein